MAKGKLSCCMEAIPPCSNAQGSAAADGRQSPPSLQGRGWIESNWASENLNWGAGGPRKQEYLQQPREGRGVENTLNSLRKGSKPNQELLWHQTTGALWVFHKHRYVPGSACILNIYTMIFPVPHLLLSLFPPSSFPCPEVKEMVLFMTLKPAFPLVDSMLAEELDRCCCCFFFPSRIHNLWFFLENWWI